MIEKNNKNQVNSPQWYLRVEYIVLIQLVQQKTTKSDYFFYTK